MSGTQIFIECANQAHQCDDVQRLSDLVASMHHVRETSICLLAQLDPHSSFALSLSIRVRHA
jgi:hypothetical protein